MIVLNSISANKMFAHLDRATGDRRPITADIFLNNFCNNRCPYCTYRRWELDADAYAMTADEFARYASLLAELGVQGFILTGGGEPTIAPDFGKICEWLQAHEIHYGVNTNFNVIQYIQPDYLKVSLDGWDEDSYERARGVRKYHAVRENIVRYAAWKAKHSPHTSLGIQKVITNTDQIMPFYEANRDLPVDYISLRPVESTGGKYYASPAARRAANRAVSLIRDIAKRDSRVVLNFKWSLLDDFPGDACAAHWAQIAVNERGQVLYCCHKPYEVVGHVMDSDILEKYGLAHTDMSMCDVPCRLTAPNLFMKTLSAEYKDAMFL